MAGWKTLYELGAEHPMLIPQLEAGELRQGMLREQTQPRLEHTTAPHWTAVTANCIV